MWHCEACGAGDPRHCSCVLAPPQDTKRMMDTVETLSAKCERYETALRQLSEMADHSLPMSYIAAKALEEGR